LELAHAIKRGPLYILFLRETDIFRSLARICVNNPFRFHS
jgi:hypothetical protein